MEAKEFFAKCSQIALQKAESFGVDDSFYDDGFKGEETGAHSSYAESAGWPAKIQLPETFIDDTLVVGYLQKNGYRTDGRLKQLLIRKFGVEFADDVDIQDLTLETVELLSPSPIIITKTVLESVIDVPKQMMFSVLSVYSPKYAKDLITYAVSDDASPQLLQKYQHGGSEVMKAFLRLACDTAFTQFAFDQIDFEGKTSEQIEDEYHRCPEMPEWFRKRFGSVMTDDPYSYAIAEDVRKYLPGSTAVSGINYLARQYYEEGLPEPEYKKYLLASIFGMRPPEAACVYTQHCMRQFLQKKGILFGTESFTAGNVIVVNQNRRVQYFDIDYLPFATEVFERFYSNEYMVRALDDHSGILVYWNGIDAMYQTGFRGASSISLWADSDSTTDAEHALRYNLYTVIGSNPQQGLLSYTQRPLASYVFVDRFFGYAQVFPELKYAFAFIDTNMVLRSVGASICETVLSGFIWKFLKGLLQQAIKTVRSEKHANIAEKLPRISIEIGCQRELLSFGEVMMGFDGLCRLRDGCEMYTKNDTIVIRFW